MKKTLSLAVVLIVAVIVLVVVRTSQFSSNQRTYEGSFSSSPSPVVIDEAGSVARLAKALTYKTISTNSATPLDKPAFSSLINYLYSSFPQVFSRLEVDVVNDYSLLIRWPGSSSKEKPVLLLSHLDVVPVIAGTEDLWDYPPFSGTVTDGIIWGRGAIDDKSGVLGILEAAELLLEENFTPSRDIYFAFGHDEEIGGQQGAVQIANLLVQRGVELEFVLDEGGVITDGIVPGVGAPVALIGPGEKGYLSLKFTARDPGGHSSQPPEITAVGRIARAVNRVQENPFPLKMESTGNFVASLGEELPYSQRLVFANQWLFGSVIELLLPDNPALLAGMRTTTAPTMLSGSVKDNVLPIRSEAIINFRILPGDSVASVTARVTDLVDDALVEISQYGFSSEPSRISSTDSFGYRQLSRAIREGVGNPELLVAPRLVIGATDARHFNKLTEDSFRFLGITLGPDELGGFHGTNERVSVKSYLEAIKIYYLLMKNVAS